MINSIIHGLIFWINSISESINDWSSLGDTIGNHLDSIDNWGSVLISPVSSGTSVMSNSLSSVVHGISSGVGSLRHSVLGLMEIISEPVEHKKLREVLNSLRIHGVGDGSSNSGGSFSCTIVHGLVLWINSISESINDWGSLGDTIGNDLNSVDNWSSVFVGPLSSGTGIMSNSFSSVFNSVLSSVESV